MGSATGSDQPSFRGRYVIRNVSNSIGLMLEDRTTTFFFAMLVSILVLGAVGPALAPYQYDKVLYGDDGQPLLNEEPSVEHPLGTTASGYDVLSRVLYGARPTMITGLLGGSLIIGIGLVIGLTAGYMGGRVDSVLMRFTDLVYGVPLLPFAVVLVTLFGYGFLTSVLVIGMILWRGSARVIRAQVLQIKERPFVLAAKATGASAPRIVVKHILPNVMSMAILFFSLGVGLAIIIQASLAFLGVSNPFVPSWGIMIRNAYQSGYMSQAWWWSLTPGLLIAFTVLSTYMFGRGYESLAGQTADDAFVQAG